MHRIQHLHPRHSLGFTLIELMVTVSVLGVLMAIALPSFQPLIERWRVRQVESHLESSLQFARSEAIKRGGNVVMQKITTNTNGNNSCAATEPVLLRYDSPNRTQISRTGGNNRIIFNRYGLVDGPYLGFNLVPHNQSISHPATRGLCMGSGGRIRTVQSEEVPCKG